MMRTIFFSFITLLIFQTSNAGIYKNFCDLFATNTNFSENFESVCPKIPYRFGHEICESANLNEKVRSDVFSSITTITRWFSGIQKILPTILEEVFVKLNGPSNLNVFELGSGSGIGSEILSNYFHKHHPESNTNFYITDLYPQIDAWEGLIARSKKNNDNNIYFIKTPVNFSSFAQDIPPPTYANKKNLIIVVSAFHHIPNENLDPFFEQAKKMEAHVLVIEPLERDFYSLFIAIAATAPATLSPIFSSVGWSERLRMIFTHWVFPIVPFIFIHDGFMSVLRQRTDDDFNNFLNSNPNTTPYKLSSKSGLGQFKNYNYKLFEYKPK
ncbi:MAG: hypothetical protein QE271_05395 [Bacteriovoracaceae bacterium]|nr:hypothetical protein [Bacteriovoracaceae bacterium]